MGSTPQEGGMQQQTGSPLVGQQASQLVFLKLIPATCKILCTIMSVFVCVFLYFIWDAAPVSVPLQSTCMLVWECLFGLMPVAGRCVYSYLPCDWWVSSLRFLLLCCRLACCSLDLCATRHSIYHKAPRDVVSNSKSGCLTHAKALPSPYHSLIANEGIVRF